MTLSARQRMPPDATNIHATVIVLGDHGIAIIGPSGAGKTTLGLSLINEWRSQGRFARLVADDQVFIAARSGRLVALAPATIAGVAEVPGLGPASAAFETAAVVDLVIDLVDGSYESRLAPDETIDLSGVPLPLFRLPARNVTASGHAVRAIVASALRPNAQVSAKGSNRDDLGLPSFFSQTT